MVVAQAFEATIVLIAWSALYFGIKHYGTVEEQRGRLLASEATAREAQLQALRYQLQPHFLFNTLNAISSLVVSKQPERATEMIAKLAGLLRNTLSFPEAHRCDFPRRAGRHRGISFDRTGPFWTSSCRLAERQLRSLRGTGPQVSLATDGGECYPAWASHVVRMGERSQSELL